MAANPGAKADLTQAFRVVRSRFPIVIGSMVLAGLAPLYFSFSQKPIYKASATMILENRSTGVDVRGRQGGTATEIALIQSQVVRVSADKILQDKKIVLPKKPYEIQADGVGLADAIRISTKDRDAVVAAAIVNAIVDSYIDYRRSQAVGDFKDSADRLRVKVSDLQRKIDAIDTKLKRLNLTADSTEIAIISGEKLKFATQQSAYQQNVDDLEVNAALQTGGANVVDRAFPAPKPEPNGDARLLASALVMGLLGGIGLVLLSHSLRDGIEIAEDIELVTGNSLPILARVPTRRGSLPLFDVVTNPTSSVAESVRSLKTSLQFLAVDKAIRVILVTSPGAGEGKSSISSNLAASLAQGEKKVLLLDADMRRSSVRGIFDGDELGLSSLLVDHKPDKAKGATIDEIPNLEVIPAGTLPPNPADLLASHRMESLMQELLERYDYIVIDSPPLLPVTDPRILAAYADVVVLVVKGGSTSRRHLARGLELLRTVGAPLAGIVFNNSGDAEATYTYLPTPTTKRNSRKARRRRAQAGKQYS
jgi:polysaccharide biosynthesis transport protein